MITIKEADGTVVLINVFTCEPEKQQKLIRGALITGYSSACGTRTVERDNFAKLPLRYVRRPLHVVTNHL